MDDAEMTAEVIRLCKAQGCICRPDVTLTRPDPDAPLFVQADAKHDSWCPLYLVRQRGSN